MNRLMNLVLGVIFVSIACRIVLRYLRPVRLGIDERVASAPPYAKPRVTHPPTPSPPPRQDIRLNLNEADVVGLIALPGIGPKLAELIVAHRDEIGAFASLDELTQVSGVGSTMVERLRPLVVLS